VEVGDGFACEAVWPSRFEDGDFDRAAVVAGSGVRLRGAEVVFVPATSTIERLHSVERPEGPIVSNSLPCLLQAIGARPRLDYWRYSLDLNTVTGGLDRYRRTLPMSTESVRLTYFHNLVWEGDRLVERDKPLEPRGFEDFAAYRAFLGDAIAGIAANMTSGAREESLRWLGTVSSGHDGATATALAAEAGCEQAITFDRSRRDEPDSGEPVARALGLELLTISRGGWYRTAVQFDRLPEVPFLAATPNGELAPFAAARPHLEGRVVVTGFMGDGMWIPTRFDTSAQVRRKDTSGMGLAEFRLVAGFIDCAPAFWTARQIADVVAITRSPQMRPWIVGDSYQRPVARRIVEEAGVPREAFGVGRKQPGVGGASVGEREFLGPESLVDYRSWLRRRAESLGRRRVLAVAALDVAGRLAAPALRVVARAARVALSASPGAPARRLRRFAERAERRAVASGDGLALRAFAYQWGLERATERYAAGANGRGPDADRVDYRWATADDEAGIFAVLETANFHRVPSPEMPSLDLAAFLVAEIGEHVIGVAGFKVTGATGKTTLMAVDPRYRGLGVGERLHELRMLAMRERGCAVAVTNADLPATIAWYGRKYGYRPVGRVEKLHAFGAPEIGHWTTLEVDLDRWVDERGDREARPSTAG